ncbi:hypothetical protein HHL16_11560 [Pseudoflavitalea sp. G-6-1-2]|uniref:hypothetical protein n=1 Tax=Pseudoflavitalea sp. G-6-1-2 TaxID=2728841 RepID=UPI00146E209A|nr:hypothetical protein [Pseudoflavitalea sp. G-6-1-2]NML21516.1 hypothetical protein [Pseudoflavitalea sp. G-6-1-2]
MTGTIIYSAQAQVTPQQRSPTAKEEKRNAKRDRINALIKQEEEGEIIFHKQSIFGFKLASDGYGLSYEIGRFQSQRVATLYMVELNEKKTANEKRFGVLTNGFNTNSVVYGKTNNFYQLKFGVGQQRIIGGKGNRNGVAVMAIYAGGLSLGLQKPYMVKVHRMNDDVSFKSSYPTIRDSLYVEEGGAGIFAGWGDVKVKPGVHAKIALRFDWGRFNETVSALEAGLNAEYYASKIDQLMNTKQKSFFFNAYISLLLGKRK